jgi:hypothetical protein
METQIKCYYAPTDILYKAPALLIEKLKAFSQTDRLSKKGLLVDKEQRFPKIPFSIIFCILKMIKDSNVWPSLSFKTLCQLALIGAVTLVRRDNAPNHFSLQKL